jgi:MFS family permease
LDAGFSRQVALWASFGCGALNWLGALPAVFTIDKFGRRKLLLITLPILSVCLFWTGSNFLIQDLELRIKLLMASIFIFMFVYSPGLGPVPFTYAAEAFPLHVRAHGMASATAVTWGLNFIISFTWPKMMVAMTPTGGFFWYATWNLVGLIFAYLLVPETKNRTLEELDAVFSVRNRDHACYQLKRLRRTGKMIFRQTVEPVAPLVVKEPADSTSLEQSSETLPTDPK